VRDSTLLRRYSCIHYGGVAGGFDAVAVTPPQTF
jgi:hypothetical protein